MFFLTSYNQPGSKNIYRGVAWCLRQEYDVPCRLQLSPTIKCFILEENENRSVNMKSDSIFNVFRSLQNCNSFQISQNIIWELYWDIYKGRCTEFCHHNIYDIEIKLNQPLIRSQKYILWYHVIYWTSPWIVVCGRWILRLIWVFSIPSVLSEGSLSRCLATWCLFTTVYYTYTLIHPLSIHNINPW